MVRELGEGGMGRVDVVFDRVVGRPVAQKRVHEPSFERYLVSEAQIGGQLEHPSIVPVYDIGTDADGRTYYTMRVVNGRTLRDVLEDNADPSSEPVPLSQLLGIMRQVCLAVDYAHSRGVVHRDLKPENVVVGAFGEVYVLDWGIAVVSADSDVRQTERLPGAESVAGSPAYMAPEQAMGGAVGPYTDLYALGVLLHELLSGDVPFAGSTALGVLHRHLYEPPVPVRRLRPEVPDALEALVLRLLSKDPQHRPDSAQETYEQLLPLVPARGIPSGGPLDPTRPFLRPHAPWPDRARTPAAQPQATPAVEKPDVAGAVDEIKRLLSEGRITQAVDILGGILPAAAAQHGEHSPVVRTLRKQYAATLMDDGQYRRALPELRRLAAERAAEAGQADPQSLRFRYEAAQCLESLGETAAALAEYRALLPYYENQYVAQDAELSLDVRRRIGHLMLALGDRAAAHETLARLQYDVERLKGPGHPLVAEIRRTLHWLGQVRG
jgi:serine/threonine protein kinase